jgi:hypothetical protein
MDLTVYVPTRGRTSMEHITLNELKQFSNVKPIVACPPNEEQHFRSRGYDVLVCPDGIGPTRQHILENAPTAGVVMLDDDMYFSRRVNPDSGAPLERCKDLNPLFAWISDQLDAGFIHGGISARQGNNHIHYPVVDCIRVNNAHFFNAHSYRNSGLRFDVLPVMEDFYVTLSLMSFGFPNRVVYEYCWSQRGSGTKGGCSLYRTSELQAQAANELARLFPDYVKVVTKTSISGGKLFSADRTDVNIFWRKLWDDITATDWAILPSVPLQLKRIKGKQG